MHHRGRGKRDGPDLMAARLLEGLQKKAMRKARVLGSHIAVTCLSHQHANFTDQSP